MGSFRKNIGKYRILSELRLNSKTPYFKRKIDFNFKKSAHQSLMISADFLKKLWQNKRQNGAID